MRPRKTLERILSGSKNIRFDDMVTLAQAFGFRRARIRGSHHIFSHAGVKELVNLQEVRGQVALPSSTIHQACGTIQFGVD